MNKQKDILGNEPCVSDIIVFNPPHYKGLVHGICVGFTKSGLPVVKSKYIISGSHTNNGNYAPKTGFVAIKNPNQ